MRLEHYPVDKLKTDIKTIVNKYLDLKSYCLFFFGSRVAGKGNSRSDIDIGIEGPVAIPSKIFSKITNEIEQLPILYKIELVDFKIVSSSFKKVALQKIEKI